jgi:hypothetical protein
MSKSMGDHESSTVSQNNPPHGHIAHGKSRFLLWVGERRETVDGFNPDLDDLPELYQQWQSDDTQADLGRWSQ